jgi:hypothetical protein
MLFKLKKGGYRSINPDSVALVGMLASVKVADDYSAMFRKHVTAHPMTKKHAATLLELAEDALTPQAVMQHCLANNAPPPEMCARLDRLPATPEREACQRLLGAMQWATVFGDAALSMPFVDDNTLARVADFLNLEGTGTPKTPGMFDEYPLHMQSRAPGTPMAKALPPEAAPYVAYLERLAPGDLGALCRAACAMDIRPLQVLIGCHMAELAATMPEGVFRRTFSIPAKFQSSVVEELNTLAARPMWETMVKKRTGL